MCTQIKSNVLGLFERCFTLQRIQTYKESHPDVFCISNYMISTWSGWINSCHSSTEQMRTSDKGSCLFTFQTVIIYEELIQIKFKYTFFKVIWIYTAHEKGGHPKYFLHLICLQFEVYLSKKQGKCILMNITRI